MSSARRLLVAGTALSISAVAVDAASAQSVPHHRKTTHTRAAAASHAAAPPQPASTAARAPARPVPVSAPSKAESIMVVSHNPVQSPNGVTGRSPGGGLMAVETGAHSQTTISRDFIAKLAPSTSAAQMMQYAPGADVGSSDPFGFSDAVMINIRGMQQSEIGYLYDGAPIADVDSYSPYTSEWGDTENYQEVKLTPGQSDLEAPLANATAGTMNIQTRDPSREFGGLIDYSYGSHKTNREFLRIDTGEIGHTGITGYVSYSNATYGQWRGPGMSQRRHVDSSFLKRWGDGNEVRFVQAYNENNTQSYNNVTQAQWYAHGSKGNVDDGGNNFSSNPGSLDYWPVHEGGWRDLILSMPSTFTLRHDLHLHVQPYYYWGSGGGGYGTTLALAGNYLGTQYRADSVVVPNQSLVYNDNGVPTTNTQAYYIAEEFHPGLSSSIDYEPDSHNKIVFGWYYDYLDDRQSQIYTQLGSDGTPASYWGSSALKYADGQTLFGQDYHLITQTNGLFIGDSASYLHDKLKINVGFKEVMVNRYGTNNLPGPQYNVGTNTAEPLPRFSASYQIDRADQVFVSGSTNFHMPTANTYFDTYSGGSASPPSSSLKNEYAITEELGFRHYGLITAAVTFFNTNITNRNIQSSLYQNGYNYSTTLNGGGATLRGIDAEFGTRPWHHFSPYFSGEYLHATTDNNLAAGGTTASGAYIDDYLPTKGKTAVLAPKFSVTGALTYDDSKNFGTFTYRWVAKQYADFMDQQALPSHGEINLSLGRRLPNVWRLKHPLFQVNFINLANWHYRSGVESISTNSNNTTGIFGSTIASTQPEYYINTNFAVMGTFTTGF
ncbi:TonB-dependent receptor [Tanticharoenia sakaeratensis]|uniref:TonB-dependent receptor n=1 Tax=Tanticharoenia sakaeratensis NBRC 103193 TaxID=1231623 RepID=A0A0D6ML29_9PROT|nr:TonB-dependent receptor [Tanticharoenia sakaeratensis]GAN54364.1 TonB-dependent receptor [Tanticharoenia sakaeratensis NBRC 103193]GBQ18823.1 TonB-dependent receptor [Tanticharoenia sakaeratensis NBRC 103193]